MFSYFLKKSCCLRDVGKSCGGGKATDDSVALVHMIIFV